MCSVDDLKITPFFALTGYSSEHCQLSSQLLACSLFATRNCELCGESIHEGQDTWFQAITHQKSSCQTVANVLEAYEDNHLTTWRCLEMRSGHARNKPRSSFCTFLGYLVATEMMRAGQS